MNIKYNGKYKDFLLPEIFWLVFYRKYEYVFLVTY